MFRKKKQDILEHKFFQMLCRELKQYEDRGVLLCLCGKQADAVQIAEECMVFHRGEYIGQMRRDETGSVREIRFVRVDANSFEKNGRLKTDSCERMGKVETV